MKISHATFQINQIGSWRFQRRDSRPLLSPEPESSSRSRDQSPRRRGLRRRSSGENSGASGLRKKHHPSPADSVSSASGSREHSPKGLSLFLFTLNFLIEFEF